MKTIVMTISYMELRKKVRKQKARAGHVIADKRASYNRRLKHKENHYESY